jgi:hypothetical protein
MGAATTTSSPRTTSDCCPFPTSAHALLFIISHVCPTRSRCDASTRFASTPIIQHMARVAATSRLSSLFVRDAFRSRSIGPSVTLPFAFPEPVQLVFHSHCQTRFRPVKCLARIYVRMQSTSCPYIIRYSSSLPYVKNCPLCLTSPDIWGTVPYRSAVDVF